MPYYLQSEAMSPKEQINSYTLISTSVFCLALETFLIDTQKMYIFMEHHVMSDSYSIDMWTTNHLISQSIFSISSNSNKLLLREECCA